VGWYFVKKKKKGGGRQVGRMIDGLGGDVDDLQKGGVFYCEMPNFEATAYGWIDGM